MIPFFLLIASLLLFRGLGLAGIDIFSTWQDSTRFALALMFLFTASAHFTKMKKNLINMLPKTFPFPKQIVFLTGIFEIAGAIGILIPQVMSWTGWCLAILMLAMFPANYNATKNNITLRGKQPTPLFIRLPMQIVFIILTLWATQ